MLLVFFSGSANFVYFSARTRFHWSYETFTLWYIIDVTVSSLGKRHLTHHSSQSVCSSTWWVKAQSASKFFDDCDHKGLSRRS